MKDNKCWQCLLMVSLMFYCSHSMAQMNHNSDTSHPKLDIQKIEQVTGMKGVEKNGEYKITVPQNDLNVMVAAGLLLRLLRMVQC